MIAKPWKRHEEMKQKHQRLHGMGLDEVPRGVSLLAVAVFRLARHLKSSVTRLVSEQETTGLVGWRVMLGLSQVPDATQKELVEFTRTEQAQLSRVLKSMVAQELITMESNPLDRREKIFSLTRAGRAGYKRLLPKVSTLAQAMDSALSKREQQQFISMCARIEKAARSVEF